MKPGTPNFDNNSRRISIRQQRSIRCSHIHFLLTVGLLYLSGFFHWLAARGSNTSGKSLFKSSMANSEAWMPRTLANSSPGPKEFACWPVID